MKRITRNGVAVLKDEIGEFAGKNALYSPPIPVLPDGSDDRSQFLNGHVTSPKEQLWADPITGPDAVARDKWARPMLPTDEEYEAWPDWQKDDFDAREWQRRKYGVWFYNHGRPTWLPGVCYYYLTYYHLDIGLPTYRDADRQFWWVWDFCVRSPNCYGLYFQTRRRQGKSFKAGCIGLEAATRVAKCWVGIQSKTEPDAKDFFQEKIAASWKKLPRWFSPLYSHSSDPKSELVFKAPAKKTTKTAGKIVRQIELDSRIDYMSSVDTAYDGRGLTVFINDEVGKDQDDDPYSRHEVVKQMMEQPEPGTGRVRVIAKELATTTSARKDNEDGKTKQRNGLKTAQKFWKESNFTELDIYDPTARTKSGLFRLMLPAYCGHMTDRYGMDLTEQAKAHFLKKRALYKNDPTGLLGETRENPFDAKEMLLTDGTDCIFDTAALLAAKQWVEENDVPGKTPWARYTLRWINPRNRAEGVWAAPDPKGRWWFITAALPRPDALNAVEQIGWMKNSNGEDVPVLRPRAAQQRRVSLDAFEKDRAHAGRADQLSRAAMHAGWQYDHEYEAEMQGKPGHWPSGGVIMQYHERPDTVDELRDDALKTCIFLGCKIRPENGKGDVRKYFTERGCAAFVDQIEVDSGISKEKRKQGGVDPSGVTNQWRDRKLAEFIEDRVAKDPRLLPFLPTIEDHLVFKPDDRKDYDLTSSASLLATWLMPSSVLVRPAPPTSDAFQQFQAALAAVV